MNTNTSPLSSDRSGGSSQKKAAIPHLRIPHDALQLAEDVADLGAICSLYLWADERRYKPGTLSARALSQRTALSKRRSEALLRRLVMDGFVLLLDPGSNQRGRRIQLLRASEEPTPLIHYPGRQSGDGAGVSGKSGTPRGTSAEARSAADSDHNGTGRSAGRQSRDGAAFVGESGTPPGTQEAGRDSGRAAGRYDPHNFDDVADRGTPPGTHTGTPNAGAIRPRLQTSSLREIPPLNEELGSGDAVVSSPEASVGSPDASEARRGSRGDATRSGALQGATNPTGDGAADRRRGERGTSPADKSVDAADNPRTWTVGRAFRSFREHYVDVARALHLAGLETLGAVADQQDRRVIFGLLKKVKDLQPTRSRPEWERRTIRQLRKENAIAEACNVVDATLSHYGLSYRGSVGGGGASGGASGRAAAEADWNLVAPAISSYGRGRPPRPLDDPGRATCGRDLGQRFWLFGGDPDAHSRVCATLARVGEAWHYLADVDDANEWERIHKRFLLAWPGAGE